MTQLHVKCLTCGKTFWVREGQHCGEFHERDFELKRKDEDVCDHVWEGESYEILEVEVDQR